TVALVQPTCRYWIRLGQFEDRNMNSKAQSFFSRQVSSSRMAANLRALSILMQFAKPYRRRMLFFAAALIVSAGCFLVIGQGLKQVVDRGFSHGDPAALNQGLFFLLGVIVVMAGATWVRFYLITWLGERVIADIRRTVFSHLLNLSPAWFEQTRTGEMISRLTTDTALLEQIIGS